MSAISTIYNLNLYCLQMDRLTEGQTLDKSTWHNNSRAESSKLSKNTNQEKLLFWITLSTVRGKLCSLSHARVSRPPSLKSEKNLAKFKVIFYLYQTKTCYLFFNMAYIKVKFSLPWRKHTQEGGALSTKGNTLCLKVLFP